MIWPSKHRICLAWMETIYLLWKLLQLTKNFFDTECLSMMTNADPWRFNLEVGLAKPVATVTLWDCLVNNLCAILSVFISTHFVSCTIQCEETGIHFLSAQVFEQAVLCCDMWVLCQLTEQTGFCCGRLTLTLLLQKSILSDEPARHGAVRLFYIWL